jgi:glyoxylase-like metal-dependent hydrolase (beta-lactamase superfamily II)
MPPRLVVHLLEVGQCRHVERMALRGGSLRRVVFPSICALLVHPTRGAVLYDTGYAAHFAAATAPFPERLYRWVTPVELPAAATLAQQLAALGVALADVRTCLISHFHADHIAGLRDLPNARFVALRADHAALRAATRWNGLRRGLLPALLPPDFDARVDFADDAPRRALGAAWRAFGEGFDLFGDGSALAVPLPGHTPGQLGLRLRDADDRELLLCADACWSRAAWTELRPPSRLTRSLMHDWAGYQRTLRHLHELGTGDPGLVILPSHCGASRADYLRGRRPA